MRRGGIIGLGKSNTNSKLRQYVSKKGMGGAVKLRNGNDIPAILGEVQHRVVQRGLTRAHAKRFQSSFQGGDATLEYCISRIADAAIAVSFDLEIEERRSVLGAVECIRDGLIDRDGHRPRRGVDFIAAVDGDRFVPHPTNLIYFPTAIFTRGGAPFLC